VTKKVFKTETGKQVYGVMAEFKDSPATYHAAETMRDAGYTKWDVYSPFPIHGIDEAMGLKKTRLPLIVGIMGLTGAVLGFVFQLFVRTDYAIQHQGKPADAWQVLIPVTFEFGVIFTAFTALFGMLAFNKLPIWNHPLLAKEKFLRVSDDKFMVVVEAADANFDPQKTREQLIKAGAMSVDLVEET
jgi:hypothetical protein